jgi:hypothetical protein
VVELVTNKITAVALWIPEAWHKHSFTEEQIETAVAHSISIGHDWFSLLDAEGLEYTFDINNEPLEFQSKPWQGVVEIQVFTLDSMTRRYVSIAPETR